MDIGQAIQEVSDAGGNLRFKRALTIASAFFKGPRVRGSHHVFKMPWAGSPRIVLVKTKGGKLKRYQIEDLLWALEKVRDSEAT